MITKWSKIESAEMLSGIVNFSKHLELESDIDTKINIPQEKI